MSWSGGYREWPPPPSLRGALACVWTRVAPSAGGPPGLAEDPRSALVLPDGCADLIWQLGRGAFIAGPDTGPAPAGLEPGTVYAGVRFRPGAGGPALGSPLSELRDRRVDLADFRRELAGELPATLTPAEALRRLTGLAGRLVSAAEPDAAVVQAAALLGCPQAHAGKVAAEVGLSERQLRRRCQAAVGYGPKTLQRVLRFRRFLARIDAGQIDAGQIDAGQIGAGQVDPGADPPDLATVAIEAGYADQAHLTRECTRLSGLTPARLARTRR